MAPLRKLAGLSLEHLLSLEVAQKAGKMTAAENLPSPVGTTGPCTSHWWLTGKLRRWRYLRGA